MEKKILRTKKELFEYCFINTVDKIKRDIIFILKDHPAGLSQKEIADKLKISYPLISYHINGNIRNKGLIEFGLVEFTLNHFGHHVGIRLTPLAQELLKVLK